MSDETTTTETPTTTVQNYTDEHLLLVREFQTITGTDKLAEMTLNESVLQFRSKFSADGESEVTDEEIPSHFLKMIKLCEEHHQSQKHILVEIVEQIIANTFTAADLAVIVAFCQTTVGKRIVELGGLRVPDCRGACIAWSMEVYKRLTAAPEFAELANAVEADVPQAQELTPGESIPTA